MSNQELLTNLLGARCTHDPDKSSGWAGEFAGIDTEGRIVAVFLDSRNYLHVAVRGDVTGKVGQFYLRNLKVL